MKRPPWLTDTVINLLNTAWETEDMNALRVLADALEESGYNDKGDHIPLGGEMAHFRKPSIGCTVRTCQFVQVFKSYITDVSSAAASEKQ